MAQSFDLSAELRDDRGKGASRRLRRVGKVPAVLYGGGREPRSISLDANQLMHQLDNESFYSTILNIKVAGGAEQAAILRDVQRHPFKRAILHIDLQRVIETEKIKMNVPLHFLGEDVAPGVKMEGGIVSHNLNDVEVLCFPRDLPEYIEVDVSGLNINESIHLSEITVPENVELAAITAGQDPVIVSISHARVIEEEPVEGEEEVPAGEVPIAGDEGAAESDEDKPDE